MRGIENMTVTQYYTGIKITTDFTRIGEGTRAEIFMQVMDTDEYDSYYIFRDNDGRATLNTSSNPTRVTWSDISTRMAILSDIHGHGDIKRDDNFFFIRFTM
jgi:hypothetical protein